MREVHMLHMLKRPKSLDIAALSGLLAIAGGPDANAFIDLELPGWSAALPDPFSITFDENGNATYVQNGLPTVHHITGTLMFDPTCCAGGVPKLVLAFALPEPVVAGTVIIPEPAASGGGTSDVLRFTDATGKLTGVTNPATTIMIYYSDLPAPGELG